MKNNFNACLAQILSHEGGWADHSADPGGATMKGITIGTYRAWKGRNVTKAELRAISDAEVAAIYRANYWNAVRGDDLPPGLDLVAFDAAVNSGYRRGAKWLQTALAVPADGKIGPQTIAAARAAHAVAVIDRACDLRLHFLRQLSTWKTFGKGWSRRVDGIRETATEMAATRPPQKPPAVTPTTQTTNPLAAFFAWLARIFGGKA